MRDYLGYTARHRARFGLARRSAPQVGRVLLAGRRATVLLDAPRTRLTINATLAITPSRPRFVVAATTPPAGPVRPRTVAEVVHGRGSLAVLERIRRIERTSTTSLTERIVTTQERQVARTEERVPQVTRVVTHLAPVEPSLRAGEPRVQTPSPATPPVPPLGVPVPPPPLDLARITDHVLGAMDHRLSAYAERLGRG